LVFELPSTHTIEVTGNAKEGKLDFLIACLSFLQGVRLVKSSEGHFYRVALARGLLTDFHCTAASMARIMELANQFGEQKPARASALLRGAIHWFLFSQSYEHAFERFDGQYKVFDAIWATFLELQKPKVRKKMENEVRHFNRVHVLCRRFHIPLPDCARYRKRTMPVPGIAKPKTVRESPLSKLRNELVHEAQFAGLPIGYRQVPLRHKRMVRDLTHLNARLILALLGERNAYVRTSTQGAQRWPILA
jgi:hypothetical protein